MLNERERKARVKIVTIFATVDEITFGAYQLSALLLLYNSFYIPTMIYEGKHDYGGQYSGHC